MVCGPRPQTTGSSLCLSCLVPALGCPVSLAEKTLVEKLEVTATPSPAKLLTLSLSLECGDKAAWA